jgi:hypothetical protein
MVRHNTEVIYVIVHTIKQPETMAYNINQLGINQSKKFRYALSDYTEFHFGIIHPMTPSHRMNLSINLLINHFSRDHFIPSL